MWNRAASCTVVQTKAFKVSLPVGSDEDDEWRRRIRGVLDIRRASIRSR